MRWNCLFAAEKAAFSHCSLTRSFLLFLSLSLQNIFLDKSLRMLIEMASFHPRLNGLGVLTFEDLMSIPFGHWGHHFILASMLVAAYGAMVAYLLIVKDTLPVVLGLEDEPGSGGFVETELVMLITSLCIMVP